MKKIIICFAVFITILHTAVQSQTKTAKPAAASKTSALTNKSVIDLQKAGLGDDIILTKIAQSKCAFDLSTDALIDLKSKGVSADVIKAMMNKSEENTSGTADNAVQKSSTTNNNV